MRRSRIGSPRFVCLVAMVMVAVGGCTSYEVYDHVGAAWVVRIRTAEGYDPDILILEPNEVVATVGFSGGTYQIDVLDGSAYREDMRELRDKLEGALFAAEALDRSVEVLQLKAALWTLSQVESLGLTLGSCSGRVAEFGTVQAHIVDYQEPVPGQLSPASVTIQCEARAPDRPPQGAEQ